MSLPRVLICSRPGIGGAARIVEALLRRLPERGVTGTAALSTLEDVELLRVAEQHGWDVERLDLHRAISPLRDARAAMRLRRIARGHDLVHAHAAKAGALARLALPRGGPPIVYAPHGFYFTYHERGSAAWRRYLGLERRLAARTTLLHCVASSEREVALAHGLATDENSVVLPNPAPPPRPGRAPELPSDGPLVLMVARLAAPKDPVTFAEAAALSETPGATFALVGAGALRDATHAAAPPPPSFVGLPPSTPVRQLLKRAAVAVLCSDSEAFPLYLAEAVAEGVPVVATDLPGCRDVAGDAGVYVPPHDAAAIAKAVDALLGDGTRLATLRSCAAKRAPMFDEDTWLDGVLAMYERARS